MIHGHPISSIKTHIDSLSVLLVLTLNISVLVLKMQVCQPVMADGTNCSDPRNLGRYIEEFTCLGVGSSARMLKEVRLSFPSGHSSYTAFTMIYCVVSNELSPIR